MTHKHKDRRGSQRRRSERYSGLRDWTVSLDTMHNSEIMNLSTSGLFLKTENLIPINSTVTLRFMPPENEKRAINVKAIVIWARKDREGHNVGMGVEFINQSEKEKEIISFYIDTIKREQNESN